MGSIKLSKNQLSLLPHIVDTNGTTNVILLQIFALPEMQLVFDHCPVTEGSRVLSGDPIVEANIAKDPLEEDGQGDGDADLFSTRPIVIEVRMESFVSSDDIIYDDEDDQGLERYFLDTRSWDLIRIDILNKRKSFLLPVHRKNWKVLWWNVVLVSKLVVQLEVRQILIMHFRNKSNLTAQCTLTNACLWYISHL